VQSAIPDRVLNQAGRGFAQSIAASCFRRERVGFLARGALSAAEFAAATDYVRAHEGIWEVILTGGRSV